MEFLAYFWDDLDDVVGACRHVATAALTETLATAVPFIACAAGMLLACAAALLLAREHLVAPGLKAASSAPGGKVPTRGA